jgi:glucose-1-phosphate cytidylyltransferase
MKAVILCGGYGSRLSEETKVKPKPLVEIGGKAILWHIMKIYSFYGVNSFILATGYKYRMINNYVKKPFFLDWNIKCVYTGKDTDTGGRLLKLKKLFKPKESFFFTYGDGVTNLNVKKTLDFHIRNKAIATVTAVRPPVRFGELQIKKNAVTSFKEKVQSSINWISGGYFVLNYEIFNYLKNSKTAFEKEPMIKLVKLKKLKAYKHYSFWQCMDTLRDKKILNNLWKKKVAPWKIW